MSVTRQEITERFIGGVAVPILIMVVSVWVCSHSHGYLPVWATPMLLVIALVGTDQFRRPITTQRPTNQHPR